MKNLLSKWHAKTPHLVQGNRWNLFPPGDGGFYTCCQGRAGEACRTLGMCASLTQRKILTLNDYGIGTRLMPVISLLCLPWSETALVSREGQVFQHTNVSFLTRPTQGRSWWRRAAWHPSGPVCVCQREREKKNVRLTFLVRYYLTPCVVVHVKG